MQTEVAVAIGEEDRDEGRFSGGGRRGRDGGEWQGCCWGFLGEEGLVKLRAAAVATGC